MQYLAASGAICQLIRSMLSGELTTVAKTVGRRPPTSALEVLGQIQDWSKKPYSNPPSPRHSGKSDRYRS